MNLNFTYPKKSGGWTYLRYDDTNPEAEKMEYIISIEDVSTEVSSTSQRSNYLISGP
jgi:hypothetical protein